MFHQRGHIDNSIVPVIIIILLLIVFQEQLADWLGPWWARVTGWDLFIFLASWIVALGLFGFANLSSYERSEASTDDLLIVENSGAAFGIATLAVSAAAAVFTVFYFNLWLSIAVIPFVFACLVSGRRLTTAAMLVTRQEDGFVIEFPVSKTRIEFPKEEAPLVLTEHQSGGAFGQPLKLVYRLYIGQTLIRELDAKTDSERFGGFLSEFLGVALEGESTRE